MLLAALAILAHPARVFADPEELARRLDAVDYLVDEGTATALFLCVRLGRPLLLEGEAGVGKTEAALALARALDTRLVRLQCWEGMEISEALYEWSWARQLLAIRSAEARGAPLDERELFSGRYLLRRPLLEALEHPGPRPAVLLIDEIDRADPDFEAFLLELLADAAVTIPELGTVRATLPPLAVLTSNRTRDLHDALKRRCLYHWIEFPTVERVTAIIRRRAPQTAEALAIDAARAVARLRGLELHKPPGVAEAIDWTAAAGALGAARLGADAASRTLGAVLKHPEDQALARERLAEVVGEPA
jgi:MoxR-like ATPase